GNQLRADLRARHTAEAAAGMLPMPAQDAEDVVRRAGEAERFDEPLILRLKLIGCPHQVQHRFHFGVGKGLTFTKLVLEGLAGVCEVCSAALLRLSRGCRIGAGRSGHGSASPVDRHSNICLINSCVNRNMPDSRKTLIGGWNPGSEGADRRVGW